MQILQIDYNYYLFYDLFFYLIFPPPTHLYEIVYEIVFEKFPLTIEIIRGTQAQPIDPDLTAKLLGRGVAVSPVVTVEPRRRKFHKAITLSMPAPRAHSQGMINQYSGNAPTLRLLCSITGMYFKFYKITQNN